MHEPLVSFCSHDLVEKVFKSEVLLAVLHKIVKLVFDEDRSSDPELRVVRLLSVDQAFLLEKHQDLLELAPSQEIVFVLVEPSGDSSLVKTGARGEAVVEILPSRVIERSLGNCGLVELLHACDVPVLRVIQLLLLLLLERLLSLLDLLFGWHAGLI